MNNSKQITIAIVTRNRPAKLCRLLKSIVKQSLLPSRVIVVDNDPDQSAKSTVLFFAKKFPVEYFTELKQGVPHARNTALRNTASAYIAFIDDDCVVEEHWVERAERIVAHFPKVTYFVGKSQLLNDNSCISKAQHIHQMYWFHKKLRNNSITTAFNVDTKNIVLNRKHLKEANFEFDANIKNGWFDCSDTDMGFFLQSQGLLGVFLDRLIVWHEETVRLDYFLRKAYYRGKLAQLLASKWHIVGEFVYLPFKNWITYVKSFRFWPKEYKEYRLFSENTSFCAFLLIKLYERFFLWGYGSGNE